MNLANDDLRAYTAPLLADGVLSVGLSNIRKFDRRIITKALAATDRLIPQRIEITKTSDAEVVFRLSSPRRMARIGAPRAYGLARQIDGRWELNATPFRTKNRLARRLQRHIWWHELGHAMGLVHPPDLTATTSDQTAMAYRLGRRPTRWRRIDRDSITGLWNV